VNNYSKPNEHDHNLNDAEMKNIEDKSHGNN